MGKEQNWETWQLWNWGLTVGKASSSGVIRVGSMVEGIILSFCKI